MLSQGLTGSPSQSQGVSTRTVLRTPCKHPSVFLRYISGLKPGRRRLSAGACQQSFPGPGLDAFQINLLSLRVKWLPFESGKGLGLMGFG